MIKQGDIIKHKAFMDVAVQIINTTTNPETQDIEVRGIWINQGQVSSFVLNQVTTFIIKKEHLSNWLKCLKPRSSFIRNEEWKQLK